MSAINQFEESDSRSLLVNQAKAVVELLLNAENGKAESFDVSHATVSESLVLIHQLLNEASK